MDKNKSSCPLCGAEVAVDGPAFIAFRCGNRYRKDSALSPPRPQECWRRAYKALEARALKAEELNAHLCEALEEAGIDSSAMRQGECLYKKELEEQRQLVSAIEHEMQSGCVAAIPADIRELHRRIATLEEALREK